MGGTIHNQGLPSVTKAAPPAKAIATTPATATAPAAAPGSDRLLTLPSVPAFTPPAKFKHLEDFKAYAQGSGISKLPAYRKQLEAAQESLNQANATLAAHQKELGYSQLVDRSKSASAALDEAQHPLRAEAAKARAEAEGLKEQMNNLARQAAKAQSQANLNTGAAGLSAYSSTRDKTLGGAAVDGLLAVANVAAANSERKRAAALNAQLAQVQAEYAAGIQVAAQLEHTPGDPATVAKATETLKAAQQAVHEADLQLAPDVARQQRAKGTVDLAQANVQHLEAAKNYLGNFGDTFTMTSRLSLPKGWKQDLSRFMQGLN